MAYTNDPVDVFKFIDMRGPDECWRWLGTWGGRSTDTRPYFQANGVRKIAYRWVWELVHGVQLQQHELVLHSCDQGAYPVGCMNPAHHRIGTVEDNARDMTARQRHGLPHNVVKAIRRLLDQGRLQSEIAKLYGLSPEIVSAIATGRVYRHIPLEDVATTTNEC